MPPLFRAESGSFRFYVAMAPVRKSQFAFRIEKGVPHRTTGNLKLLRTLRTGGAPHGFDLERGDGKRVS
jgi:hypothetical protein